jgi:hypothetical protein
VAALGLGAVLLAGCGPVAPPGPLHAGGLTVTFAPDPPVARHPDRMCVRGASGPVTVRMFMPGMSMGPVPRPALAAGPGGQACGSVLFLTSGRWDVELELPGGGAAGPLPVEVRA